MYVIRLRHAAVFCYAGSSVIRPKSSAETRICRRSIARIAPCSIGKSYVLPVRLSVIVSVSAIGGIRIGGRFGVVLRNTVVLVQPAAQVRKFAAFAAERPVLR